MKKILIIEDELLSASRLKKMLLNIDESLIVDGPLRRVEDVNEHLQMHNDYDLIFSDVRLLDGDVFSAFKEIKPLSPVVYTTAYDEYAMSAIKSSKVGDYLMKPIDEDDLFDALEKVKSKEVKIPDNNKVYSDRFCINSSNSIIKIETDKIDYFHKDAKCAYVVMDNGDKHRLKKNIHDLIDMLNPEYFFQINRQYIVNYKAIKNVVPHFNSKLRVVLRNCDDDDIFVSREKAIQFREWFGMVL